MQLLNCPICNHALQDPTLHCTDHTATSQTFGIVFCENCTLGITVPHPDDLLPYYNSPVYHSHNNQTTGLLEHLYQFARAFTLRSKFRLITKNIAFDTRPQLLDVGCGTGSFIHYCQKHNLESTGIEPVERARAIAAKDHPRVFRDIHQLDERMYDIITLWHVLEHLKDLNHTIEILSRRLKPNGKIFIAVPNYLAYDAKLYREHWAAYDVPRHLWHFNEQSMRMLMSNHHLKLNDIKPMYLDSFYVSLLSERIRNNQRLGLAGFLRGIWIGAVSNLKATGENNYSSLIYRVEP